MNFLLKKNSSQDIQLDHFVNLYGEQTTYPI